ISAHFRFQVIGSNFRGFYQDPVFSFIWLLNTAVKEESYMRIFLCLCNTGLFQSVGSKKFSKSILNGYLVESYLCIRNCRIILCKAYIGKVQSLLSLKSCKIICAESSGDLSCSVRTEVKEDNGIFILDPSHWLSVFYDHGRNNKFICLSF